MRQIRILAARLLRGGGLASALLLALPWLVLIVLGMIWLVETGHFLLFVAGTTIAILLARLPIWLRKWQASRAIEDNEDTLPEEPSVAANPDWSERETQVYAVLCQEIRQKISAPQPWPMLPELALGIAENAARQLSQGNKGALDFSIPEALLLTDRILLRIRGTIRETLPLADRVSIGTLFWIWQNRSGMQKGMKGATLGWRFFRLAAGPVQAVLQEVQNMALSGLGEFLTKRSLVVLQRMILEEVAHASVELHSGRLRFSDAELLSIQLGSEVTDRNALAQPDKPLRLLVIGQVSAGKSTLINALAGSDLAETDMAPTTPGLVRHDIELEGLPFHVIDTQGIDGGKATEDAILTQMRDCDLALWVVRANRPARAPDVALMQRFRESFAADYRRRMPPLVVAISATDSLLNGWPYSENILPEAEKQIVTALVTAVSRDLNAHSVVPLCAEEPVWNVETLAETISDHATEALMTQRNRRRLDGEVQEAAWSVEASRAREGISQTAGLIWSRMRKSTE
jgi:uncharacterized protein